MNRSFLIGYFVFFILCGVIGCGSSSGTTALSDTEAGTSTASSAEAVSQSLSPSSTGMTSSSLSATQALKEEDDEISEKAITNDEAKAVALGTGGCSDADATNVSVTATCDDVAHTAKITRVFSNCVTETGVTVSGTETVTWTNLGTGACVTSTGRPAFFKAVAGQGTGDALQVISTDPDTPTSPVKAITRTNADGTILKVVGVVTIDYSKFAKTGTDRSVTETVTINTSRIKYKSDGTTKIFDHTIATGASTPLVITLDRASSSVSPVRTIQSGTVTLTHNLAKYSVTTTFNGSGTTPVVYDYNTCECYPVSGQVNLTTIDTTTNKQMGSGSITYSNTPSCGTISLTYGGKSITPPKLAACR